MCWKCGQANSVNMSHCIHCFVDGNPTPLMFGRHQVISVLGSGSFGQVFKCFDPDIDRYVAVKKLTSSLASRIDAVREMKMSGRLDHANIVRIFDVDTERGFIVMEYVSGGSLADRLKSNPGWVQTNFSRLFLEIGEGLRAAHAEHLIHRDIKPANILLTGDGTAKIADFGLARILTESGHASSRVGSPAYVAPEVVLEDSYDLAADIHSLGCVMYETWAGCLPFETSGNVISIAMRKQRSEFASLRERNRSVDDVLNELVGRMISNDAGRIRSMEQVLQHLRHREPVNRNVRNFSVDEMQQHLGYIYSGVNSGRSPLILLGQLLVVLRAIVTRLIKESDDAQIESELDSLYPRAFAWLCAVATSINAQLGQLIWLKFDDSCPYCEQDVCNCVSIDRTSDVVRNQQLLERMKNRRLAQAPRTSRTVTQEQAKFRRIYGQANLQAGPVRVGLHAFSEVAEATDALLHLSDFEDASSVSVLQLEISDLIAWFFALLNLHRQTYNFHEAFAAFFANGCYACVSDQCQCPKTGHERALSNWRNF